MPTARSPDRLWLFVLALGMGLVVAYAFVPEAAQMPVYLVVALSSVGILARTAVRREHRRRAWIGLSVGVAGLALGDVAWYATEAVLGHVPFPSGADALYLAGTFILVPSLFYLVRHPERQRTVDALIDASIFVLMDGLLLWVVVIAPAVNDPAVSGPALTVAVTYPLLDLALFAVLGSLLFVPRRSIPALHIAAVGFFALLVADVAYAVASTQQTEPNYLLTDLGWISAFVLLAVAALHPSSAVIGSSAAHLPQTRRSSRRVLLLWVAIAAAAVAVLVVGYTTSRQDPTRLFEHLAVAVVVTVAMCTLMLLRMWLATNALESSLEQRQSLALELTHLVGHDDLTALANRREFNRRAEEVRGVPGTAVVFLDLDRFKEVNDGLGHAAGDQLLRIVASRLRQTSRDTEVVARLGGDEFAVLLTGADEASASLVADRVLAAISRPVSLTTGDEVAISASVGVAVARPDDPVDRDLVHDADVAMYVSKRGGGARVTTFTDGIRDESTSRLTLRSDLRRALGNREFRLVFQPILSCDGLVTMSAEALLRWYHPAHGEVSPSSFVPEAEASGDIVPVGAWALEEACRQAAGWNLGRLVPVGVNVNVSPVQLHTVGFVDVVDAALSRSGLAPTLLTLEITETSLLDISPDTIEVLSRLRRRGVRISVDDFGTGYSALRYLANLPLDEVKVDRDFVAGVAGDRTEAALALAVLHLGRTFGLSTVAEGVETSAQLSALHRAGCDAVQGFLLARPMSPADLLEHLAAEDPQPQAAWSHRPGSGTS